MSIVEKSNLGIKLLPIKKWLNARIDIELEYANEERKRRF